MSVVCLGVAQSVGLIDNSTVGCYVSTCIGLLAAALIVLSLVNLQASGPGAFRLDLEARRDKALSVVRSAQVAIWASGLGALDGLICLVVRSNTLRWLAFALTLLATTAFLTMSAKTVSAVVSSNPTKETK